MTSMLPAPTRARRRRIRLATLLVVPALVAVGVLVQKGAGAAGGTRTLRMEVSGIAFLAHPGHRCPVALAGSTDTELTPDNGETGGNAQAAGGCSDQSRDTWIATYATLTDDDQIVDVGVQGNIHSTAACEFHTFEGDCEQYAHIRNATLTPAGETAQPASPYRTTLTPGVWKTFTLRFDQAPNDTIVFRVRASVLTG
jgi:hypothetical protein